MNEYQKTIRKYIRSHKDEIVRDLTELIKIPSVSSDRVACRQALEKTRELYEKNGFSSELFENGEYLLSCFGEGKRSLGLFAHADVVSAGEGWTLTEAFVPLLKNDAIVGRGTLDDKAGIIISLYVMKMIKELQIPFNSRVVAFTGSNEEDGMDDVQAYASAHTPPDFSLIIDSDFPLYHGNKGIVWLYARAREQFEDVIDFCGGKSVNITLGKASARVAYSDELMSELLLCDEITVQRQGKEIMLEANGISTHGALPEGSKNAGLILASALASCPSLSKKDRRQLLFVKRLLSDYYGRGIGIEHTDKDFGALTFTNGIARVENGRLLLSFDTRFGKELSSCELTKKIERALNENGMELELIRSEEPHITDKSNPFLQKCLGVYRELTGDRESKPLLNAGGTYARYVKGSIEIGTSYGGKRAFNLRAGNGGLHQPDEYISVEGLLNALEITANMMLECDND